MSNRTKRIFKIAVIAVIGANLVFYAALYPPGRAALVIAAGRGPNGRFVDVLRACYRDYKQNEFEREIARAGRVVKRDAHGFQLVEIPGSSFWEPGMQGSAVLAQLAELKAKYFGLATPIRRGDIVLDCGANVGTFTRYALSHGAKLVVAIEPAPKNIVCLRRNFPDEIASGRVIIYEKGVWDKEDFLRLAESDATDAMDSFVRHEGTHEGPLVPLTTIDNLVQELHLERVDFIKMDIEGAEQRALTGARQTLAKYKPRMEISVNHLTDDPEKVPLIVEKLEPGYKIDYLLCEGKPGLRIEAAVLLFH